MNNTKYKIKVGDKVYIEDYDTFGIAKEINSQGQVTKAEIKTPSGVEIINTLNLVVTIARIVEKGLLPILKAIVREIASWFTKKDK